LKDEAYSRSSMDDAAEQGSDSTRDDLSGSDLDAGPAPEPRNLDDVAAAPVPMPRRRRTGSSVAGPPTNKSDKMLPTWPVDAAKPKKHAENREEFAAGRRERGTDRCARLGIVDLFVLLA